KLRFFVQAEDGIRDRNVTGVQTCALPIYQIYLRHSGEARFQDCFHLFFQDVKMGAVILNQDMTVLQTNKAAQEISQVFWEQYRHNQGHFLRSNYQGDPKFREVQTMINEISDRLTTQGGTSQTFTSLSGDIS